MQTVRWSILSFVFFLFPLHPVLAQAALRFAVIGDYGNAGQAELDVSTLVKSWTPDVVITTGDNNYELGSASTIDQNIGQYYHEFIFPYTGSFGAGDTVNRFFPSLGNHDWDTDSAAPYKDYFVLPNNERYYDFVNGPVHFFALDSDPREPDGITGSSIQASWLQAALSSSSSSWNIVYFHHPPFSSSSTHGSTPDLQWPFRQWGADAILTGHDHTYERLIVDSLAYFVNGLGGKSIYQFSATPVQGSEVRYNADWGAMLVVASTDSISFQFFTRGGLLIDTYTLRNPIVSTTSEAPKVDAFSLEQNYPNPFNSTTTIAYSLPNRSFVRLTLVNVLGQEVALLVSEEQQQGTHQVQWRVSSHSSGVYFYRLKAGTLIKTRKLLLLQ